MLIRALNDYYDILAREGRVPPEGFSRQRVRYTIMLNPDGRIDQIVDDQEEKTEAGEKKGEWSGYALLPKRTQKPGIDLNIAEHRPLYIFGLNGIKNSKTGNYELSPYDATGKAAKAHRCFAQGNLEFTEGLNSPVVLAYRNFLKTWTPEQEARNQHLTALGREYDRGYYCFALAGENGVFLHEDEGLLRRWKDYYSGLGHGPSRLCPIAGEWAPAAGAHDKIKAIFGSNMAGGILVCVNNAAEESYTRKKWENSNISEKVMRHYCEALNTLLRDPGHRVYQEGITTVFWGMTQDDSRAAALFQAGLNGGGTGENGVEHILEGARRQLVKEGRIDFSKLHVDPRTMFYIACLMPNNTRIIQKFFYKNHFGTILGNILRHQTDMRLENSGGQKFLWQLYQEMKLPQSQRETVPAPLACRILQTVVDGGGYPDGLLDVIVRRAKADTDQDSGYFGKINPIRAGIIKAYFNRKARLGGCKEEFQINLDSKNTNTAYLCGRLFALMKRIQADAAGGRLEKNLKNVYFASACAAPVSVFPRLLNQARARLLKNSHAERYRELMKPVLNRIGGEFPGCLSLEDQGRFILGYYQQDQELNEEMNFFA